MTEKETAAIMLVLQTAYPNFYSKQSDSEKIMAIKLWHEMFSDDNAAMVTAAVKSFIVTDTRGFPPSIGIIKNKMSEIRNPDEMTDYEAWNLVKKAVGNGIYGAKEEYDKLPPVLQRLVGSPNKLREWAQMESATVESVVGSNFMRSYNVRAKHEREYAMLPEDVKRFISVFAEKVNLNASQPKELTESDINDRRNEIRRQLESGNTGGA